MSKPSHWNIKPSRKQFNRTGSVYAALGLKQPTIVNSDGSLVTKYIDSSIATNRDKQANIVKFIGMISGGDIQALTKGYLRDKRYTEWTKEIVKHHEHGGYAGRYTDTIKFKVGALFIDNAYDGKAGITLAANPSDMDNVKQVIIDSDNKTAMTITMTIDVPALYAFGQILHANTMLELWTNDRGGISFIERDEDTVISRNSFYHVAGAFSAIEGSDNG